jgi:hypothetical protein
MRLVVAAVLLVLSASSAAAQTDTGEISGVVRDTQGGVLPESRLSPSTSTVARGSSV